ncbi:hypothetical protein MTR67_010700 [Solanum verrucosum]|uniref:Protein kinase domain-containing protein n=1 Tax=Solanum verrucosum TaxID=315347 RepID=A0AAF0Q806_SOLVR|nr:hypothetical protein MTR67_010700 [Solanum verrucosum]
MAEREADVIQWSGGWRMPVFKDYMANVRNQDGGRNKQNVSIDLSPNPNSAYQNVILNGLEIFKLSDPNENLFKGPIESPPSNKKKKRILWHIIVAIIVGVTSAIAVFSILGFLISRRRRQKDSGTSVPKSSSLPSDLCRHFLIADIKNATINFDEKFVIGYGGFSNVYKGYLDNGTTTVAVKRSNPSSKQGCDDENEMILVYDYMANGTLRDHLYNTDNAPLPWKKRLDICIGAAKGLYYLHSGTKHTIIHRDVKSTNILLDNNWVAKVSDFGLSKVGSVSGTYITHVSTAVKGSFGSCEKRNVEEIIDPNLKGQIASECLSKFAELAYHCLREQGVERPSMGDVVGSLEFALQLQEGADNGCKYPSFPFIIDADANIATNEDHEIFSDLSEVESKSTSNSISGSAKLKNVTIFSELMNPVGRQHHVTSIALISFLFLQLITATISTTPPPYDATVYVLLNCGAQSATTDETDRRWDTDTHFPNSLFAFLTVSASSSKQVQKEYVINVDETQILKLTFSPSPNSYAFVNGIEILSMPTDLYIHGDVKLSGHTNPYNINNSTALETLYRLNVGGNLVGSTEDTGMYRVWDSDDAFVVGYGYQTPHFDDANITYTSETPAYSAPRIVYTASRTMANHSQSLDWEFPLNSGFYYLFRLHFSEREADVIQWSGGWRIPVYKDYVVNVRKQDGEQNVTLDLSPNPNSAYQNALLNGLEIFKLNDSNGNLSVPNPEFFFPNNSPPNDNNKRSSSHIIAVITAVAVISGIALLSILCFLIFRRWKRGKELHTSVTKSSWIPLSITSNSTQRTGGSGSSALPSDLCRHFLLEEIKTATCNFDEKFVIGYGGFGNVYKGYIDNGATIVAVKRLNPSSKQGVREFETEIHMLSKLRHVHLVSLIGYCDDNNEMILVYDYMSHGTLRDHLYKTDNAPLPWKKRLEICIGAAKGLHYLHTGKKDIIIHRDVKSTNILLDDKWVAKVSDFGLSKIGPLSGSGKTHVSTVVKGSFGYLDPEYYKRQQLTEKSDVYSFGVVLFEVLCARPALIPNMPKGQVNLADWACRSCKKGNLQQIIDPNLEGQIAPECLNKFAEAAYNCLKDQGVQRPSMNDVVWNLEFILKLQDAADNRGHKMELNSYPTSPSFPLIMNDHTNISTDEGFEAFSGSHEVGGKYTSSATSMTSNSDDKLKSDTIFSEILNPSGR